MSSISGLKEIIAINFHQNNLAFSCFSLSRKQKVETSEKDPSNPNGIHYSSVKEIRNRQPATKKRKIAPPSINIAPLNSNITQPNSNIAPPKSNITPRNIIIAPTNSNVAPSNRYIATQNRMFHPAQMDHSCYSSKRPPPPPPPPAFQKLEIAPPNRNRQFVASSYPTFNIFNNFSTFINDQNDSVCHFSTLTYD